MKLDDFGHALRRRARRKVVRNEIMASLIEALTTDPEVAAKVTRDVLSGRFRGALGEEEFRRQRSK